MYESDMARGWVVKTALSFSLKSDGHDSENGGVWTCFILFQGASQGLEGRGVPSTPCPSSRQPWDPMDSHFISEELQPSSSNGSVCIWSQPIKQIKEQLE